VETAQPSGGFKAAKGTERGPVLEHIDKFL
jgi:hypothetical protein